MASIKCMACGLVNFATAASCKRCQQPLHEMAPFADQRPYQQGTQQSPQQYGQGYQNQQPQQYNQGYQHAPPPQQRMPDFNSPPPPPVFHEGQAFQSYELPPPPPAFHGHQPMYQQQQAPACCVKCGTRRDISIQQYKKDYVPPLVYLSIFLGWLILLILILVLRKRHDITLPWCNECWRKFKLAKAMETVTSVGCLVLLGVGLCAGIGSNNMMWFVACLVVGFGSAIWGHIYHKQNAPKYAKIDREKVIVTPFAGGDICFQK